MTDEKRLKLLIDVFELPNQPALALPTLTPPQLIDAILQEFQELEYIGSVAKDYQLLQASDRKPLADDQPLARQVSSDRHLILAERAPAVPPPDLGLVAPEADIYLKELNSGQVFKISWLPAIIGRPDRKKAQNIVSVDLSSLESGLLVSRQHAKIIGSGNRFFIESMSHNPTQLKDTRDRTRPVSAERLPLQPGDTIILERSKISLKFIVRPRGDTD
jgi:hypothetical protein